MCLYSLRQLIPGSPEVSALLHVDIERDAGMMRRDALVVGLTVVNCFMGKTLPAIPHTITISNPVVCYVFI